MVLSPLPPPGYRYLPVTSTQILLPLTISNKCGQSFRWRSVEVYDTIHEDNLQVKSECADNIIVKGEDEEAAMSNGDLLYTSNRFSYRRSIEWSICLSDRVVFVRQDEERGYIYHRTLIPSDEGPKVADEKATAESASWLEDYLNLKVPLAELYEEWSEKDEVFKRFAKRFSGVRMLRQDPWECLCAFICSSNNNIARIGQMVQNLCTHYSKPLLTYTYPPAPKGVQMTDGEIELGPTSITYYPFPSSATLSQPGVEEKLRELSFGYRARYIAETARMLIAKTGSATTNDEGLESSHDIIYNNVEKYLHNLRTMTYEEARRELLQFPGVGPKVADCILLMSMDQPSSIPVDRHVFQFAERWYRIKTKGGLKGYEYIANRFRLLWGEYAGWAHSVLFTADLRAFSTYKREEEEEMKIDMADETFTIKQENEVIVPSDILPEVKKEEEIFYDSGRPARLHQKRPLEEQINTISHTFKSVKRTSQYSISNSLQHHRKKVE